MASDSDLSPIYGLSWMRIQVAPEVAPLIADAAFSSVLLYRIASSLCYIISSAIKFIPAHTPSVMNRGRSIPFLAPMRKIMSLRTWFTWIDRTGVCTVLARR